MLRVQVPFLVALGQSILKEIGSGTGDGVGEDKKHGLYYIIIC